MSSDGPAKRRRRLPTAKVQELTQLYIHDMGMSRKDAESQARDDITWELELEEGARQKAEESRKLAAESNTNEQPHQQTLETSEEQAASLSAIDAVGPPVACQSTDKPRERCVDRPKRPASDSTGQESEPASSTPRPAKPEVASPRRPQASQPLRTFRLPGKSPRRRLGVPLSWLKPAPHEVENAKAQEAWSASLQDATVQPSSHDTTENALSVLNSALPDWKKATENEDIDIVLGDLSFDELTGLDRAMEELIPSNFIEDDLVSQGVTREMSSDLRLAIEQMHRGDFSRLQEVTELQDACSADPYGASAAQTHSELGIRPRQGPAMHLDCASPVASASGSGRQENKFVRQSGSPLLVRHQEHAPAVVDADNLLADLLSSGTIFTDRSSLDWIAQGYWFQQTWMIQ